MLRSNTDSEVAAEPAPSTRASPHVAANEIRPVSGTVSQQDVTSWIPSVTLAKAEADRSQAPVGSTLTLGDAILRGIDYDADLATKQRDIRRAEVNYTTIETQYASDVAVNLAGTKYTNPTTTITNGQVSPFQNSYGFEITWTFPWWQKANIKYDAQEALLTAELDKQIYYTARMDFEGSVVKAYIDVVNQEAKLRIRDETLKIRRQRRDETAAKLKIGTASSAQLVDEEAALKEQEVRTANQEKTTAESRLTLSTLIGIIGSHPKLCSDVLRTEPYDPNRHQIEDAILDRTRGIRTQIARQQLEVKKQELIWYPKLGLRAGYLRQQGVVIDSLQTPNTGFRGGVNTGFGGGFLTIPVPLFANAKAQMDLAQHDLHSLDVQEKHAEVAARAEDARLRQLIESTGQQIQLQQELVEQRMAQVRSAREDFALGRITGLQVAQIEDDAQQAELNLDDYRFNYNSALVDFERLHGRFAEMLNRCPSADKENPQ
jgi:outer membrane protein TolC